jgi:hypothetical protein
LSKKSGFRTFAGAIHAGASRFVTISSPGRVEMAEFLEFCPVLKRRLNIAKNRT